MESINLHDAVAPDIDFGISIKNPKPLSCTPQNSIKPSHGSPLYTIKQIKENEDYWIKQLENTKPALSLPFDAQKNNKTKSRILATAIIK